MEKSSKSIIEHIPQFLDYCKRKGLSINTQKDYKHYLNKFIFWLKKENKNTLLPSELTINDIETYRLYLSSYKNNAGQLLRKTTQNYYLIALRSLLSYFTAEDIVSLPADKICLLKDARAEKTVKFLNLDQIERLLLTPDIKDPIGLRDRAILAVLISTGLKIAQLKNLNRDKLEQGIPGEALEYVKEYLKTREDINEALFINYRSRKHVDKRLTPRSIERIVQKYGKKINLPFSITPEILRWARALALSKKEIEIKQSNIHQIVITENYNIREMLITNQEKIKNYSPTWYQIENIINKEVKWLKNNIPVLPERYKQNPSFLKCDDCILRKIAILITGGKVKATEFQFKNGDLWNNLTNNLNLKKISRHGEEWHRKMMDVISNYFMARNYEVNFEPILPYGRADLGIFMKSREPLYVEIDTVSLFKLWYNLSTMKDVTFLLIPSENYAIEFKV